jgi:collagen type VI alpha
MLAFIKDVVTQFGTTGGDIRFGLVDFSDDAIVEFYLDTHSNVNDVLNAIDGIIYFGGRTDIADGFQTARENLINQRGDRSNAPNIVILITDGIPNDRIPDTQPEANLVKQTGAQVVTVGITTEVDADLLRALASNPSDYIASATFAELSNIVGSLVGAACPTVTPTPRPTPTPGMFYTI